MLAVALHLRGQELSLRDIAGRLVISTGKKKGQHPSPATVMRILREHDEKVGLASVTTSFLTLHRALALAQKLTGVVRIIPWLLVVCRMDAD
jgi:hypothetical protein